MPSPTPKVELYIRGAWIEVTSRTRAASVTVSIGRTPGAKQAEGARIIATIMNDDGWLTEGNPLSPWYPDAARGCQIRVSGVISGVAVERATATINTMRLVTSGPNIGRMQITATGTLQQIGQGSEPLLSALRRGIPDTSPIAYWPCEDGSGSTLVASGISGGKSMRVIGYAKPGSVAGPGGSAPLIDLSSGASLVADVPYSSATSWRVELVAKAGPSLSGGFATLLQWNTLGGAATWELVTNELADGGLFLQYLTPAEVGTVVTLTDLVDAADGQWHHFRVTGATNGGSTDITVVVDGSTVHTQTLAVAFGRVTRVTANPTRDATEACPALGHITVWAPFLGSADTAYMATGYSGELGHVRFARLCAENGIAYTLFGSASAAMGPQRVDTLGVNLQDIEDVDHGLLHDGGTGGAVVYLCLDYLTNRSTMLTIPKNALADGLSPIWDNQLTANDVTSSRPSGSSARVVDTAHIAKIKKRWPDSTSANVATDAQLGDDAGWTVWIGTAAGPRYDDVGINGHDPAGVAIATQLAALAIGDRLAAAESSLTSQHPPGGLDQLIVGRSEFLDAFEWRLSCRTVPYAPYVVGILAATTGDTDPLLGWLESDTCELNTGVSATAASWAVNSVPIWSTLADDFPCAVVVDDEPVIVTAVTGGSNPQTWTVTRHPTLARIHDAGADIALVHPIVLTIA